MEEWSRFIEAENVSEAKCPCHSPFFWNVGAKIFTGAYGKEDIERT